MLDYGRIESHLQICFGDLIMEQFYQLININIQSVGHNNIINIQSVGLNVLYFP